MRTSKRFILSPVVTLLLLCAPCGTLSAAEWGAAPDSGSGQGATRSVEIPLAPLSITQNVDPNTLQGGTAVCLEGGISRDTSWWRLFDLDDDHGLVGEFCVQSVDYGIETATDDGVRQFMTINSACLDDGLPFTLAFLDQVGSVPNAQPDAVFEFFNGAASGCCDTATQSLAVELASDDCVETGCVNLFHGSNFQGQTGSSYITAPDCGAVDPYDADFFDTHIVMIVNGEGTPAAVPASSGIGVALMIVLFIGAAAYFMKRRSGK